MSVEAISRSQKYPVICNPRPSKRGSLGGFLLGVSPHVCGGG
jgi:hypothetical protein